MLIARPRKLLSLSLNLKMRNFLPIFTFVLMQYINMIKARLHIVATDLRQPYAIDICESNEYYTIEKVPANFAYLLSTRVVIHTMHSVILYRLL